MLGCEDDVHGCLQLLSPVNEGLQGALRPPILTSSSLCLRSSMTLLAIRCNMLSLLWGDCSHWPVLCCAFQQYVSRQAAPCEVRQRRRLELTNRKVHSPRSCPEQLAWALVLWQRPRAGSRAAGLRLAAVAMAGLLRGGS